MISTINIVSPIWKDLEKVFWKEEKMGIIADLAFYED